MLFWPPLLTCVSLPAAHTHTQTSDRCLGLPSLSVCVLLICAPKEEDCPSSPSLLPLNQHGSSLLDSFQFSAVPPIPEPLPCSVHLCPSSHSLPSGSCWAATLRQTEPSWLYNGKEKYETDLLHVVVLILCALPWSCASVILTINLAERSLGKAYVPSIWLITWEKYFQKSTIKTPKQYSENAIWLLQRSPPDEAARDYEDLLKSRGLWILRCFKQPPLTILQFIMISRSFILMKPKDFHHVGLRRRLVR